MSVETPRKRGNGVLLGGEWTYPKEVNRTLSGTTSQTKVAPAGAQLPGYAQSTLFAGPNLVTNPGRTLTPAEFIHTRNLRDAVVGIQGIAREEFRDSLEGVSLLVTQGGDWPRGVLVVELVVSGLPRKEFRRSRKTVDERVWVEVDPRAMAHIVVSPIANDFSG